MFSPNKKTKSNTTTIILTKKTNPNPSCPFCNHKDYNITYKGEKSKEERNKELIEEQKVIEAQIRAQSEERKNQEEREKKIREERMSQPEMMIEVRINNPQEVTKNESFYERLKREKEERDKRIRQEREEEERRLQQETIQKELQNREIQRREIQDQQQREQQEQIQLQLNRLKDYVPENIFNDLTSNTGVDFDTMMLNEAIRLSELAEKSKSEYSNVMIDTSGRINCDDEKELAQRYGIRGFPTIKVFNVGRGNKNNAEDYQSGRDAKSIADFAMYKFNSAYDPVTKVKSMEEIEKIEKEGKPVVLLFSNKNSNPALFKSLAIEYTNTLRFAFVGANEQLNKEFKITASPKIVVVKPIDEEEESLQERVVEYDGRLKKIDLMSFLAKYATGNFKPQIPSPKQLTSEMYTGEFCKTLCILGCSNNRKEFNNLAKKFHKDEKFKFSWVDLKKNQNFCKSFQVDVNSNGVNLIALRSKKLKYATLNDASNESSEKFLLKILNGEMKFSVLDELPKFGDKKDEL